MSHKSDVIVVTAHPDDEIFVSGTICLCAEKRFDITLVCATSGEEGSRELLYADSRLDLGAVRRHELALSAWALGVKEVLVLGQADAGAPETAGAPCAWDRSGVIAALGRIIEQNEPALILTHGPLGGYGHPAHRLLYRCVMAAAEKTSFSGSIFAFCGRVENGFFSWHFDQPSDVRIDARGFLRRRVASLSYHQSQIGFFVQPAFPRTVRKYLSALFGYTFAWTEAGRKRVPIATVARFFRRFPVEGLVLCKAPAAGRPHFFLEHFGHDDRVQIDVGS
jgi:LmbE family N-acetylglucosaminyl deacetylase